MFLIIENKSSALAWTALAVILSLTTWFSATAVIPELTRDFGLTTGQAAWLTNAVQLGFVFGALGASLLSLADVFRITHLMAVACLLAGVANAAILLEPSALGLILARAATGVALALIYPPAMKLISTWFRTGRSLSLGIMVGSLTLGSALPHLVRGLGAELDWQSVIIVTSLCCLLAGVICFAVLSEGPYPFGRASVDPRQIGAILKNRPLMLANAGYFGHMWELYAMWGWMLAYAQSALIETGHSANASFIAFAAVAAGVPGCIYGGILAERIGRAQTTIIMMAISATCGVLAGVVFGGPLWLFWLVVLIWGFSAVADSAQFSAEVTDRADQTLVGSALAFQMGVGFAITVVTIWIVPVIAEAFGSWRWAFLVLVPGPLLGCWAMWQLKKISNSSQTTTPSQSVGTA